MAMLNNQMVYWNMSRLVQMTITTEEVSIGFGSSSCRKDIFGWSQLFFLGGRWVAVLQQPISIREYMRCFSHVFAWCTCPIYRFLESNTFCQDDVQNTSLFSTFLSPSRREMFHQKHPARARSASNVHIISIRHIQRSPYAWDIEKPKLRWNLVKPDQHR